MTYSVSSKNKRRKTTVVSVGDVKIGGTNPIVVQAMAKTGVKDIRALIREIKDLVKAGARIVRLAIPDEKSARAIKEIKRKATVPLIADIHFNAKLAERAIENGIDGIRLNPGNMRKHQDWERLAEICRERNIPIRVGVNSGSVSKEYLKKYPLPQAMVENALHYIKVLEKKSFTQIKISLKASSIADTVEAYRLMAKATSYPFHLGITASGPYFPGTIKSSIGLGILLYEGLGDTIRVSLTTPSVLEVDTAYEVLSYLGLNNNRPEIISCPTCGRCEINLIRVVAEVEKRIKKMGTVPLGTVPNFFKIAIMGCPVNGPGEAKEADIGLACGKKKAVLFKHGKVIKTVSHDKMVDALFKGIQCF
ncbi:MAG: flavodoxin-dependent (E)-4-hydroxy-3-methylbut-2-enyl-diphosphate synthase [Candidatus Omnitrophica bacterium]|nr:flavodoxin-dependent (E)-4-hydroxy-3-methylbut-2-enyl-diphosphate synthase [Candidatus Omnitrophota bacterium]